MHTRPVPSTKYYDEMVMVMVVLTLQSDTCICIWPKSAWIAVEGLHCETVRAFFREEKCTDSITVYLY